MTISVLLPTRMRPDRLAASVLSLTWTAAKPQDLELLIAVDGDDPSDYSLHEPAVVVEDRYGYRNLHRYYNDLAELASGDWLLLWNDDCIMDTEGWDDVVRGHEPRCVLSPHTVHEPLCTFPIIPARFARAVGHYAENLHVDTWWQDLANKLGIMVWPDIHVSHQRFDVTGEAPDRVYRERVDDLHRFYGPEQQAIHDRDVEIVRGLL